MFSADGCLRRPCSSDGGCDAGEVCRTVPEYFNDFFCEEGASTCGCGGDPLAGTVDVCVPDTCP